MRGVDAVIFYGNGRLRLDMSRNTFDCQPLRLAAVVGLDADRRTLGTRHLDDEPAVAFDGQKIAWIV